MSERHDGYGQYGDVLARIRADLNADAIVLVSIDPKEGLQWEIQVRAPETVDYEVTKEFGARIMRILADSLRKVAAEAEKNADRILANDLVVAAREEEDGTPVPTPPDQRN